MSTIHHIVIPIKSQEEINKARDFFVGVLGFRVERESDALGKMPKSEMGEGAERLPDYYCHLFDDNGLCLDLVGYDGERTYQGVTLGIKVDDINDTWDALKDYPVRKLSEPAPYPDAAAKSLNLKSGSTAFLTLDMGRVSKDGEEQGIQFVELNPL